MPSRTAELLRCFFTGTVSDLPPEIRQKRTELWGRLADHEEFLDKVRVRSSGRRGSMYETATRSNYLAVVDAFVAAAGAQVLVAPDTRGASEVLLKIGMATVFLAACILVLAISAKAKVWKKPRPGGFSEADEMLQEAVDAQEQVAAGSKTQHEAERDRAFDRLHKRKLVLVVERRGQHAAGAVLTVVGVLVMIVGICIR
jgi:Na+-transporting methylmalonyl-CoA/oxaloacetate decarboxylase gamma subunit